MWPPRTPAGHDRTVIEVAVPKARSLRTATGRVVGYYEYGAPSGRPVVAMHGTPASGAGYAWADAAARDLDVRIVAPDRPGIGASDPWRQRGARVVDYPSELEAFVDALGIEQFRLLGYSGGGPYALACAHALADRVEAIAVVAGAGNVGVWARTDEFEATDRQLTFLSMRAPVLARATLAASAFVARTLPTISFRFALRELSEPDRAVMREFPSERDALMLFTEAVTRGTHGVVADYVAQSQPWGFAVEDIRVPMQCWHGTDDRTVPIRHSEELVARVPGAGLTRWEDAGHLALVQRIGEVLRALDDLAT